MLGCENFCLPSLFHSTHKCSSIKASAGVPISVCYHSSVSLFVPDVCTRVGLIFFLLSCRVRACPRLRRVRSPARPARLPACQSPAPCPPASRPPPSPPLRLSASRRSPCPTSPRPWRGRCRRLFLRDAWAIFFRVSGESERACQARHVKGCTRGNSTLTHNPLASFLVQLECAVCCFISKSGASADSVLCCAVQVLLSRTVENKFAL